MKKAFVVVSLVAVLLAALAVAGFAYAQKPDPSTPYNNGPFGSGMMGGWGMMGNGSYGPLHEYMQDAMAVALGLTHEEFENRLANGETPWTIAQAKGLSAEEFSTLMTDARSKALDAAVADGVLTQEQADWMKERMGARMQNGYGPGSNLESGTCPMGGGQRGPGGRWNRQP